MRVLESKPVNQQMMGKKKHKLRKQSNKDNDVFQSDSSDEAALAGASGRSCSHISKAVNLNAMRKAVKQHATLGECTSCNQDRSSGGGRRGGGSVEPAEPPGEVEEAGASSEEALLESLEPTIWVCLQCGHQGCDRNSKEKHALKHYQTPRSGSHSVVININTWSIWCYDCDEEVLPENSRSKLHESMDFLRKQLGMARTETPPGGRKTSSSRQDIVEGATDVGGKDDKANFQNKTKICPVPALPSLPKVKGLSNLGNTCFFNAVMQNLSQTPTLESILSERAGKGAMVRLPGYQADVDSEEDEEEDSSYEEEEDDREAHTTVESVTITLTDGGGLTQSVLAFLRDMHSTTRNSIISPTGLFGQVCKKAPRFKGFQQQDSHELLRHLLDGMKAEEVKRSQSGILKIFHLPENVNPKKVDEETKLKIKEYGRLVKHTFIDSIFGGYFISTVLCEECHMPSQIFEPFQDISLPITEEKPMRPNNVWSRKDKKETSKNVTIVGSVEEPVPLNATDGFAASSKHMSKKAKKQAKREAKKRGKGGKNKVCPTEEEKLSTGGGRNKEDNEESKEGSKEEESVSNGEEWDSKSDADVEDNIESDVSRNRFQMLDTTADEAAINTAVDGATKLVGGCHANDSLPPRTSPAMKDLGEVDIENDVTCTKSETKNTQNVEEVTEALTELSLHQGENTKLEICNTEHSTEHITESKESIEEENNKHEAQQVEENDSTRTRVSSSKVKKSGRKVDAQMKAMNSLAPRYQPVAHECSVLSCLNQFTAAELLTGNNKFGCIKCTKRKNGSQSDEAGKKETVYTNASKQVLIFSPPAVLTLHLKRFQQVGFSLRKVNRHVTFPLTLDLAPYCSSLSQGVKCGQSKVLYSLYGVVEHSGRLTGGHYTAYVKVRPNTNHTKDFLQLMDINGLQIRKVLDALNQKMQEEQETNPEENEEGAPPNGKWYYISDSRVNEVTEASVLRCQAYLLFYERIY